MFAEHPLLKFYPPDVQSGLNASMLPADAMSLGIRMQPNTALLSLILMLGTFFIAFFMRKFKNSRFLGGKVRSLWDPDVKNKGCAKQIMLLASDLCCPEYLDHRPKKHQQSLKYHAEGMVAWPRLQTRAGC